MSVLHTSAFVYFTISFLSVLCFRFGSMSALSVSVYLYDQ